MSKRRSSSRPGSGAALLQMLIAGAVLFLCLLGFFGGVAQGRLEPGYQATGLDRTASDAGARVGNAIGDAFTGFLDAAVGTSNTMVGR